MSSRLSHVLMMHRFRLYLLIISFIIFVLTIQLILSIYLFNSSSAKQGTLFDLKAKQEDLNLENDGVNKDAHGEQSIEAVILTPKTIHHELSEQLDLTPPCFISNQRAISAINRAHTQKCKQEIANIACLSQNGTLYPKTLPQFCPHKDISPGPSLGCYRDESTSRVLSGHLVRLADNSPLKCAKFCMNYGFQLAGLQYRNECFCGQEMPHQSIKLSHSACNMRCPGSHAHNCGGYFAIDIYKTGLEHLPKNTPSPMSYAIGKTPVKIVFLLTVNGRAVRQIKRLLKNIYHERHFYYIHVDSRQDYLYRELLKLEEKHANIKLSRVRLSTIWGGASLLQMLLSCISDLFQLPELGISWDYVINLSESDFPIKTLSELELFLTANKGKNFVKSHGQHTRKFISKQGLDKTFYECDTHMWRVADRELPLGIRWDGGSDWVGLTREFCEYFTFEDDLLVNGLKQIFKYTLLPAESFFHTVLQNSRFCEYIVDNNLRITNWRRKQGCKCQYKHIVDWCGCSPNDFKLQDWPRLAAIEAKPHFFARKFEPSVNLAIINRIEEWLDRKRDNGKNEKNKARSNEMYWQNEYHFREISPFIDDAKLTLYYSMASLAFTTNILNNCHISVPAFVFQDDPLFSLKFNKVNEAHLLFDYDEFKGILISFESYFGTSFSSVVHFEAFITPLNYLTIHNQKASHISLINLQVCSDFDLKEQLFRNFGCVLGPFSKISVLHKWMQASKNISNVTFIWINPNNDIAASNQVNIQANQTGRHFPHILNTDALAHPHQPGIWKLLVFHDGTLLGETLFLISPLYFVNRTQITREESKILNSGQHKQHSHSFNVSLYENMIVDDINTEQLKRKALKNARKSDKELLKWIIDLTSQFWHVEHICNVSELQCNQTLLIKSCSSTHWSSYSPDYKSEIE